MGTPLEGMDYKEVSKRGYNMPRMDRLSAYKTNVTTDSKGITRVTYHSTVIVSFWMNGVFLNSGGWRTATTKNKMNQAARQFGLNYSVFQRAGEWFVNTPDGITHPFEDGMYIATVHGGYRVRYDWCQSAADAA